MSSKISVILPVFNARCFLQETIESLICQSCMPYEIIAVDDGSTDGSIEILKRYSNKIQLICQSNQGAAAARNTGIAMSQGDYLAFQDADDVALPLRLEKQLDFLEGHPEVGILGAAAWVITTDTRKVGLIRVSHSDTVIRWQHLLRNPFVTTSVVIRRSALPKCGELFNPKFPAAQDFEFWGRVLQNSCAANLMQPLVKYRIHPRSISSQYKQIQQSYLLQAVIRSCRILLPEVSLSDCELTDLGRFINFPTSVLRENNNLSQIIWNYIRLWEIFQSKYSDRTDISLARSDMISITFLKSIQLLSPKECHDVFNALKVMDRFWWYRVIRRFPMVIENRRLQRKIQNMRREVY